MQDELEVIAGKTELANTDKEQYKLLVNEAEAHYAKMEYRESIPKYQEALRICKPHFVPAKAFLVQRLDSSKRRIQYLEHYSEGEKAMHAGNYDLAIEFFKQAMSSEDNAQVQEALKLAERRGKTIAPPPVRPKQKKKSAASGLWWIAGVLIVAILGYAVFAIIDSTRDIRNTYDRLSQDASDITNEDMVENTDATRQAQQNAITPGEFIPGSWKVERMEVAGQPFGTNPTVHFYPDGRLVFDDPSGQLSGTWSSLLNYMELYLPEYSAKGTITEIDKERMTWNTVVNNRGFESNATWYLARISGN